MSFQIHTIAIIAEGIPEAQTRRMIRMADERGVTIIGPATVPASPSMNYFVARECVDVRSRAAG